MEDSAGAYPVGLAACVPPDERATSAGGPSSGDSSSGGRSSGSMPDKLESFLEDVTATLVEYVMGGPDSKKPVVKLKSPAELDGAFSSVGVSLELGDGDAPTPLAALHRALEVTLDLSVRTHHPLFLNQLYSQADPVAIAADWSVVAANTNVHTFEVAPVFTVVERHVLDKMARCVGGSFARAHEGLFVPGGSIANIYSMHLARARAVPNINKTGLAGGPRLVAFTSAQAHYSYKKAASLIGLGYDNLVAVECDECGAMVPEALARAVQEALAAGALPFFVGATAGTTVTGAFDPFDAIADVAARHGMWMHIDGSWGAAALLSSDPTVQALMAGAGRADSLTWNAHKLMGAPQQCSTFLVSGPPGQLAACNGTSAAYLFQPDKLYAEYDLGDKTIQCGRRADAFKLWLAWRALGDEGWAARVDHCLALAKHFENKVRSSCGKFVMAKPRTYTNVCFWYVPSAMRPWDPATADEQARSKMARVAVGIKAEMQRRGLAMIGFQPLGNLPNFFRIVFPSCINTTMADVEQLLAVMEEIGEGLEV